MKKSYFLSTVALFASFIAASPSQAGHEIWDPTVSTCATNNCSSILFGGTVMSSGNAISAAKWEAAVFGFAGECIRLDETAMFGTGSDDEMTVVAPNGSVYRNDDFGGTLRPRVAFVAPNTGWYYVTISRYNGSASPEHDFYLAYGRYSPGTNANCASATAPQIAAPAALKMQNAAPEAAPAGSPTGR